LRQCFYFRHFGWQHVAAQPQSGSQPLAAQPQLGSAAQHPSPQPFAAQPQLGSAAQPQAGSQQLDLQHFFLLQKSPSRSRGRQQRLRHFGLQHFGWQQSVAHPQDGSQAVAQPQPGSHAVAQPQPGSAAAPHGFSQQDWPHSTAQPHPLPSIRSSSSKPWLWLHNPTLTTSAPITFHFIEQRLLFCWSLCCGPYRLPTTRVTAVHRRIPSVVISESGSLAGFGRVASAPEAL
jgi:hypothetical protein